MLQTQNFSKESLAMKREAIKSMIEKIDDGQLLDRIQELVYKTINGFHTEVQIMNYLEEKYKMPISRGMPGENSGSFLFQQKQYQYRLERFYLDTKNARYAFEIDENFHAGPSHDPAKELVREFEYFKHKKEHNVVLIRYGFRSKRKDQPLEKFVEKRASVILLLINNLIERGSFYQTLKAKIVQGHRHLVCFYGYPPDNRHISEHTIFNDKVSKENFVEIEDKAQSTMEGKLRVYIFAYDIKKVNEVYKENYEYSNEKKSVPAHLIMRSSPLK